MDRIVRDSGKGLDDPYKAFQKRGSDLRNSGLHHSGVVRSLHASRDPQNFHDEQDYPTQFANLSKDEHTVKPTFLMAVFYEFVGTFCFAACIIVTSGDIIQPLWVGLALFSQILFYGKVSGGHFNPAVTLSCVLRPDLPFNIKQGIAYIFVQILGAFAAGFAMAGIAHIEWSPQIQENHEVGAFFGEVFATFLFVLTIIVVTNEKSKPTANFAAGALIIGAGLSIFVHLSPLSGGCLNPAIGLGLESAHAILTQDELLLQHVWIYLLAPILGGFIAVIWFFYIAFHRFYVRKQQPLPTTYHQPVHHVDYGHH